MDSQSLFYSLDLISGSGHTLNVEQRTTLRTTLMILKKNYKFSRVLFWGKIMGLKRDYFIAQGRGKDELKDKRNLYSFDCAHWFLLPPATDSMIDQVSRAAKGLFTGDPTHVYEHTEIYWGEGEEGEDEATEELIVTKVSEETRLSVTVHLIDEEVSVVPRGAFVKGLHGLVQTNQSFGGLSYSEASQLNNFLHFRESKYQETDSTEEESERRPTTDFLDELSDDVPKGSWSLQFDCVNNVCVLRSLLWLGLTFYHVPMTAKHGYIYIGSGTKNIYLPFML